MSFWHLWPDTHIHTLGSEREINRDDSMIAPGWEIPLREKNTVFKGNDFYARIKWTSCSGEVGRPIFLFSFIFLSLFLSLSSLYSIWHWRTWIVWGAINHAVLTPSSSLARSLERASVIPRLRKGFFLSSSFVWAGLTQKMRRKPGLRKTFCAIGNGNFYL